MNWYASIVPWLPSLSECEMGRRIFFLCLFICQSHDTENSKYAPNKALWRAIKTLETETTPKTTMTLQDLFVLLSFCFPSVEHTHTHTHTNFFFLNFFFHIFSFSFLSSSFIVLFIFLPYTLSIYEPQPYMIHEWQWINLNLDLLSSRKTRIP